MKLTGSIRRSFTVMVSLLLLLCLAVPIIAYAAATYYCSGCHAMRQFRRTNTRVVYRTSDCPTHEGCDIVEKWQLYDLHCTVCGYGGGAHGGEELISRTHRQVSR